MNRAVPELCCPGCGSTDPQKWMWVQYTRVNYAGVRVTDTEIAVKSDGVIEYESVINEALRCQCGCELDLNGRKLVYV